MPSKSFGEIGKKFNVAATNWGGQAQRSAQAQGNPGAAEAIAGLTKVLAQLVQRLVAKLEKTFDTFNPFPAADPITAFLDAAIDDMLDTLIAALDQMANTAAAGLDAAVAGVLGLFEAIKKAIHLVLDQVKIPGVVEGIELILDLINNVIGNIAELVSRLAGKIASTFRMNMYGQLAAIRAAQSAKPQAFVDEDGKD